MTATELQDIALTLSNQCHCRIWYNLRESRKDVVMAIQCLEMMPYNGSARAGTFQPIRVHDLERKGFSYTDNWIYTIPRTNEDGTPYTSELS